MTIKRFTICIYLPWPHQMNISAMLLYQSTLPVQIFLVELQMVFVQATACMFHWSYCGTCHLVKCNLFIMVVTLKVKVQSAPVNSTGNSTNLINSTIWSGHIPLTPYVKSKPKFNTQTNSTENIRAFLG